MPWIYTIHKIYKHRAQRYSPSWHGRCTWSRSLAATWTWLWDAKKRESCRTFFNKLKILPLTAQYILSLLLFMANNRNLFITNSEIHDIQTRQGNNLHLPMTNLTICQHGVYYSSIKIFNKLPLEIKNIVGNPLKFKHALKKYLNKNSFYTLEEYFNM
jgi:hypothetical protein